MRTERSGSRLLPDWPAGIWLTAGRASADFIHADYIHLTPLAPI